MLVFFAGSCLHAESGERTPNSRDPHLNGAPLSSSLTWRKCLFEFPKVSRLARLGVPLPNSNNKLGRGCNHALSSVFDQANLKRTPMLLTAVVKCPHEPHLVKVIEAVVAA